MHRLIIVIILILLSTHTLSVTANETSILETVTGTWELDPSETDDVRNFTCDQSPLTISISEDAKVYTATQEDHVFVADILNITAQEIHIQYHNEERLDDAGSPVSWHLVLSDSTHFYWVRNDWRTTNPSARTFMRRKCPSQGLNS